MQGTVPSIAYRMKSLSLKVGLWTSSYQKICKLPQIFKMNLNEFKMNSLHSLIMKEARTVRFVSNVFQPFFFFNIADTALAYAILNLSE